MSPEGRCCRASDIQQINTAKNRNRRAAGTRQLSAFQEHDGILQGWLAVSEEGIFVVQDGRIRERNRFLARLGGYLQDEVLDTVFTGVFDDNSIPAVESACSAKLPGTRCASSQKVSLVCTNGQRVKVQLKVQPSVFGEKPASLAMFHGARLPAPLSRHLRHGNLWSGFGVWLMWNT